MMAKPVTTKSTPALSVKGCGYKSVRVFTRHAPRKSACPSGICSTPSPCLDFASWTVLKAWRDGVVEKSRWGQRRNDVWCDPHTGERFGRDLLKKEESSRSWIRLWQ